MNRRHPSAAESDQLTRLGRVGVMFNVGTLTALVMLIPAALLAGSGHFGEAFKTGEFAAILGGAVTVMVLLCLWTPFARKARALSGLWWSCVGWSC